MSASLVGSEMCIRDSPHPPLARKAPLERPPACFVVTIGLSVQNDAEPPDCLLYTSDAADDM
eukprot:10111123-Alexandrium_andersonii.AAC.1